MTKKEVSYSQALVGAFILGDYVVRKGGNNVGLLLPNLVATALIFLVFSSSDVCR